MKISAKSKTGKNWRERSPSTLPPEAERGSWNLGLSYTRIAVLSTVVIVLSQLPRFTTDQSTLRLPGNKSSIGSAASPGRSSSVSRPPHHHPQQHPDIRHSSGQSLAGQQYLERHLHPRSLTWYRKGSPALSSDKLLFDQATLRSQRESRGIMTRSRRQKTWGILRTILESK